MNQTINSYINQKLLKLIDWVTNKLIKNEALQRAK